MILTRLYIIKGFYNDNDLNNIFVTKYEIDKEEKFIDVLYRVILAYKELR